MDLHARTCSVSVPVCAHMLACLCVCAHPVLPCPAHWFLSDAVCAWSSVGSAQDCIDSVSDDVHVLCLGPGV